MATQELPELNLNKNDFPSNSNVSRRSNTQNSKEPTKQSDSNEPSHKEIRQVATAKVRKQGLIKRIGKSIIEDNIEEAKDRAFNEVIIPGLKNLLYDTGRDILETILFGVTGDGFRDDRRRSERFRRSERTSYSSYYKEGRRDDHRASERDSRDYYPDDIILDTRGKARDVLDELDRLIDRFGQISVLDFYDVVGVTGSWTDKRYGWSSIRGASIRPVRDGFMIVMPRAHILDD